MQENHDLEEKIFEEKKKETTWCFYTPGGSPRFSWLSAQSVQPVALAPLAEDRFEEAQQVEQEVEEVEEV